MRPSLELQLDLRSPPTFGPPALYRIRRVASTALGDSPIEDDLDAAVRSEAFTEIRIQVGVLTGDDEQRAPHLSLVLTAGELRLLLCSCRGLLHPLHELS